MSTLPEHYARTFSRALAVYSSVSQFRRKEVSD